MELQLLPALLMQQFLLFLLLLLHTYGAICGIEVADRHMQILLP
jgi:hypothetical protein